MKATKALPTEERIRQMNDQQWLWFYLNIKKDEEEEEDRWKQRLDYLAHFINPELAKSVINNSNKVQNTVQNTVQNVDQNVNEDIIVVQGDEIVSSSFEDELKKALSGAGSGEEFTELPESNSAGNHFESQNDFINRVLNMQQDLFNLEKEDIDIENKDCQEYLEKTHDIFKNSNQESDLKDLLKKNGIKEEDIDFFEYSE